MLGFHSIRPDIESGRPLRNTATAYSAPTLRARCEAPSPAPGFDHGSVMFQSAGALSTDQYKRAVSKQRLRPQTANRPEGRLAPVAPNLGLTVVPVFEPDIIVNKRWFVSCHEADVSAKSAVVRVSSGLAAASFSGSP